MESPIGSNGGVGGVVSVCGTAARDPPANDVDVGLLAGLDDAQILVNGPEVGDDPIGARVGTMLGAIPAGPRIAFGWSVGGGVDGKHAVAELSRECGGLFVRQTG